jgi:hypothetical protein
MNKNIDNLTLVNLHRKSAHWRELRQIFLDAKRNILKQC